MGVAAIAAVLVVGCGAGDEPSSAEPLAGAQSSLVVSGTLGTLSFADDGEVLGRKDPQGPALLGSVNPQLDYGRAQLPGAIWLVSGRPPIDSITVTPLGLKVMAGGAELAQSQLPGLAFHGNTPAGLAFWYYIGGLAPDDALGRHRYVLWTYLGGWSKLCAGGAGEDWAYTLPGWFDSLAAFNSGTGYTSFACRVSAGGKSVRWGYAPTAAWRRPYFQASTRMARADYCGLGHPETLPGTPILMYDLAGLGAAYIPDDVGPGLPTGDLPPYSFEAAWSQKGAAICLSKRRWQAIAPLGPCDTVLPDPRLINNKGARFCDELGWPAGTPAPSGSEFLGRLAAAGGYTFNESMQNDIGLWSWQRDDGSEQFTTSAGFWSDPHDALDLLEPPADGYTHRPTWVGAAFTYERPGTVALRSYFDAATGDHSASLATTAPAGYVDEGVIAFVYATPPAGCTTCAELKEHKSGSDYLLVRSGNAPPAGYAPTGVSAGFTFR